LDARARSNIEGNPLFKDYAAVKISAERGDGLHQLRNRILERTDPKLLSAAERG
jgi:hypothetical protein